MQIVLSSTPRSVSKEYSPDRREGRGDRGRQLVRVADGPGLPAGRARGERRPAAPHQEGDRRQPELRRHPAVRRAQAAARPRQGQADRRLRPTSRPPARGRRGWSTSRRSSTAWAAGGPVPAPTAHRGQLAGNVLTLDWTLDPNGYTEEENKVVNETKKILGDATIGVCPTCVRVPVKVAHSEAINVEFDRPRLGRRREGGAGEGPRASCSWTRRRARFPQPIHAEGSDHTFVGRVRQDPSNPNALCLWVVADNLRKGAATQRRAVRRGTGEARHREVKQANARMTQDEQMEYGPALCAHPRHLRFASTHAEPQAHHPLRRHRLLRLADAARAAARCRRRSRRPSPRSPARSASG